jgi:hypothetical protein
MSDSISQLIQAAATAKTIEEKDKFINQLAQIGEPAIPEMLKYERTHGVVAEHEWVLKIYQLIGYPANRSAIPSIVAHASIINSNYWEIAMDILISIGEPAIPDVRETLRYCFKDLVEYCLEIQGLCVLLEQMGSPLIDPLLPELLFLLENGTDENYVDDYALWPIKKIGSPKADAAIPFLSRTILSKRGEYFRKASIEALLSFDLEGIRPLLPMLRECLSDPSGAIRASAKKVLEAIGEEP